MSQLLFEEEVRRYCSAQPVVPGIEGSFPIGPFVFENGQRLNTMQVGFVTHGQLNARRDNAVLLLPGTTNTRHSADGYIGPANAFDPERHFIIAFEAIGAGTSSKPSDGLGSDFPIYNIRDLVSSQFRVVTELFGLTRLAAVAGASMGAFQALEWAIAHPLLMERVVLVVPAVRAGHIFKTVVAAVQEVLKLDPHWGEDRATMTGSAALRAAVRLYFPWTVSDAYLERMPPALVEREIESAIDRSSQWNAWDFVRRYQASASHDVGILFEGNIDTALARVRARTLILSTSSERLLGSTSARELATHIAGSKLVEVPTDRGHLGWRAIAGAAESRLIAAKISSFLNKETPP
jgi:homoserine O-acetyltransferase